jgi:hypothetical protein
MRGFRRPRITLVSVDDLLCQPIALGTENQNLPGFVVLPSRPAGGPSGSPGRHRRSRARVRILEESGRALQRLTDAEGYVVKEVLAGIWLPHYWRLGSIVALSQWRWRWSSRLETADELLRCVARQRFDPGRIEEIERAAIQGQQNSRYTSSSAKRQAPRLWLEVCYF